METLKAWLKRILPPPVYSFMREINGLRQLITEQGKNLRDRQLQQAEEMRVLTERQCRQLALMEEQQKEIAALKEQTEEILRQQQAALDRLTVLDQLTALEKLDILQTRLEQMQRAADACQASLSAELRQSEERQKQLADAVERTRMQSAEGTRHASEAVWAEISNNTISGSGWLKNTAFSPGRWALGYPALYVMYRVLNETRPKRILELGLGQSTRMIAQYAAAHEDVEHIVVEHDPEWIDFFENDFTLSERTKIVQLDREMVPYKEAEAVRVFKGFREAFAGQKFDFIFIDAPLGGDMKQYARIDVLGLLPECLGENFVIMIDDCERSGETHTVTEMENRLRETAVPYKRGRYCGKKDCTLICAEHSSFLTTM